MGAKAKIGTAAAGLAVAAGVAWTLGPGLNGLSDDALAVALGVGTRPPVVAPPHQALPPPPAPVTTPGPAAPVLPGGVQPVNRPQVPTGSPDPTSIPAIPAPGVPQPGVPSPVPLPPTSPSAPVTPSPTPTPTPTDPSYPVYPVPPSEPTPPPPATGCVSDTLLGSLICEIAAIL